MASLHPAVTVTNIRNFVTIILDNENAQYVTWSELFRIHCTAFLVADHLAPRKITSSSTTAGKDKAADPAPESWERLDAIVLQWIYGTISPDLPRTILKKNTTAYDAWTALQNLFEDNKASRALYLQAKLTNTRLENFKDMAAYCQEVKTLADQLLNVDVPLTDTQLVLQLLGGLTEQYVTIATVLRSKEPLPDFNNCRSALCHEETQRAATALYAANSAAAALHVASNGSANSHSNTAHLDSRSDIRAEYNHEKGRLGSNNNSRGRGRGRGRGRQSTGRGRGSFQQFGFYPWTPFPGMWPNPGAGNQQWQQWASTPPCPYPTTTRPNSSGQGVLGPRPAQAYNIGYTPTDIEQALHTMALNPPEQPWYMDTGATNHMTNNPGPQDQGAYPTQQ